VTAPGLLAVSVPSWRNTKDISIKDDLVEEVGRMIGYDSIVPVPPSVASVVPPNLAMRPFLRKVRDRLAAQGFSEVYNYTFVKQTDLERFGLNAADHIAVKNPIASELTHLRRSLLPGIFNNLLTNVKNFPEFRWFEIGNEIHPSGNSDLPVEIRHLCAAFYNEHGNEDDFFELKRVLECVFPKTQLRACEPRKYEHPARAAEIFWGSASLGRFFELHPSLLRAEGIEGRAFLFDLNLAQAEECSAASTFRYHPPRKFPTSGFDLSVIAAMKTPVAQIEGDVRTSTGSSLVSIEFVRQYAGPPLPEGQKSVSYHLEIGSNDHTLTADEVTETRNNLIENVRRLGYELRV
jgi:phenylalanyl-tRNA synthetase beta chain